MKLRWPGGTQVAIVVTTLAAFMAGGHFAAKAIIGGQQSRQLAELTDVALRRSEVAVAFGAATLDELASRGSIDCEAASLQAFRFLVYQRSGVKDIRLLNRDGSVLCSAYSETLEFDNGWVDRPNMSRSSDQRLLLFRVDRFNAAALGVLREIGDGQSLVAILGLNSDVFDIMPAELRAHSEVLLELGDGFEVGRFSLKGKNEFSQLVELGKVSSHYPLHAMVRVEQSALGLWHNEAYWPTMLIALGLGLVFGLLATRAMAKLEGPVVDIDRGIARCEFKPFFQPIFDLRTGDILGCEALARWIREDGTIVPPMSFIPLVESSGRIEAMTWLILETALKELYPRLREDKHFKLSFNVVPRHLLSEGFVETLRRIVLDAKVSARQIVLEVTERNEMPNLGRAATVVKELRELGFRVAMDDVGVGHSGLSQMKGLGANTIKIDKFFVDTITEDGSAATIVQMLVRLARDLGMAVIAEGIETPEQIQALIECGVEEGQGYIVSPPLPFVKFDELLEIRRSKAFAEAAVRQAALVA